MRNFTVLLFAGTLMISTAAVATLPLPTPEEQAAAATQKAKEKKLLELEQERLTRVQERLGAQYGSGGSKRGAKTDKDTMPATTSAPSGTVGPTPTRPQSGEAHSAPAK